MKRADLFYKIAILQSYKMDRDKIVIKRRIFGGFRISTCKTRVHSAHTVTVGIADLDVSILVGRETPLGKISPNSATTFSCLNHE